MSQSFSFLVIAVAGDKFDLVVVPALIRLGVLDDLACGF